uniref:BTB domain-containing protein n=1 Tax=Panagrellus redivivus TaxID=6233 RepID=A0A7E4W7T7_PANRE
MAKLSTDLISVFVGYDKDNEYDVHDVPDVPGLKWSLLIESNEFAQTVSAHLHVIGAAGTVTGAMYCQSDSEIETKYFKFDFVNEEKHVIDIDGFQRITCTATFLIPPTKKATLAPLMVHELIDPTKPTCFDATIKVEGGDIKVHRGFLSMISPVFSVVFGPDTSESKTGIVSITDFTHETVKNALDYCYGRNVEEKPMTEITDMLRFYDKYDIEAAIEKLEAWLTEKLTVENFVPIAVYAWQYSLESLQGECGKMFLEHVEELACHPDLVQLDPNVIAGIYRAGAAAASKDANE